MPETVLIRKRRMIYIIVILLLLFLFSYTEADNLSCLVCHSSIKGKVLSTKNGVVDLSIDQEKFRKSVHGDFDCTNCHPQYTDNPHRFIQNNVPKAILDLSRAVDRKSKLDPIAEAACIQCHEEVYQTFSKSVHGKNLFHKKKVDGPICTDCHGSAHYIMDRKKELSPVDFKQVVKTCGNCHEKKELAEKYGFSLKVLERYKESFHGKKHFLGHKGAPVCTTCHGSHNVKSATDPQSPVFGKNRLTTCGNCHPGANNRFVAAITHKPVGRDNPIPYYFEKMLIILTITVMAGTVFHVLLDTYANIRNYLWKKKGSKYESS